MKKIATILLVLIIFTIVYITTFHLNTRKLIPVYTYYGIFSLTLLTLILTGTLLLFTKKKLFNFDIKDTLITLLLFFFGNLFVFCMIPVTLERSISVFMLNEMNNKKEYTKEEIEHIFIDKYVYEYGAFEKRFEEQIYTGTIIKTKKEKYKLNKKGKKTVKLFNIIKEIYNVKGKILN